VLDYVGFYGAAVVNAHCLMMNYSHSIAFDIISNDTGGATNLCSKNVFH